MMKKQKRPWLLDKYKKLAERHAKLMADGLNSGDASREVAKEFNCGQRTVLRAIASLPE